MTITYLTTTHFAFFALISLGVFALQVLAEEPGHGNDYGRTGLMGMRGNIEWESLLQGDGLEGWKDTGPDEGAWSRDGDTIVSKTEDAGDLPPSMCPHPELGYGCGERFGDRFRCRWAIAQ